MAKLLLLSILIAPIVIGAKAANLKNPRIGFKKAMIWLCVFNFIYLLAIVFIYAHL